MHIATGRRSAEANLTARQLLDYLEEWQVDFSLDDAHVFFEFPLYRDDERLIQCQFLLLSKTCGIVLVGTSAVERAATDVLRVVDAELDAALGQLVSRLVKSSKLRQGRTGLKVEIDGFVFTPEVKQDVALANFRLLRTKQQVREFFQERQRQPIPEDIFLETISTIEGAKGLIRPKERPLDGLAQNSRASRVAALEEEINRFDRDQKEGYLTTIGGVQRIRGLAGSGKTVVLAMRAALLLLRFPEARIALTFHTKSLYQHVRRLITRFYRQYDDRDPDWEKMHVLHAWGGRSNAGIYFNACQDNGFRALTFSEAAALGGDPFGAACNALLTATSIRSQYDYVLVDEAQDFHPAFLRLCFALAKGGKLVFAYDQLQTIFQVKPPSVEEIFGVDEQGNPKVQLENDIVLHKCYRNPLEITVCAHALGFGIYGNRIVQMLENEEHWRDLGYVVESGEFKPGALTTIKRLSTSSPSSISKLSTLDEVVSADVYADVNEEINAVVGEIVACIKQEGLRPDDLLVVAADDRNAKLYLQEISQRLQRHGIETNNMQLDAYSIQDFSRENSVTLSTIHKAKGNEAYQVFVVGIDALFAPPTVRSRNLTFTALTRAKAWLRVTGVGQFAQVFKREIDEAEKASS